MSKTKVNTNKTQEFLIAEIVEKLVPTNEDPFAYRSHDVFAYMADYDSDSSGCNRCGDDYCRCSRISSTKINSIDINSFVNNLIEGSQNNILNYCIDRICRLNEIYDTRNWEANVSQGYYGEEVNGCSLDTDIRKKTAEDIQKLLGLSDIDQIKHVLVLEYGYLIEKVAVSSKCEIVKCAPVDVRFPQGFYKKKVKSKDVDFYNDHKLPRCIVSKDMGIIDGYHRTTSAVNANISEIEVIVLS